MLEGLDLMLFLECADRLEEQLGVSNKDDVTYNHTDVTILTRFLISDLLTDEQVSRTQHILNRCKG